MVYGQFSADLAAVQQLAQTVSPAVGVQDYELALEWFYRVRMRDGTAFEYPVASAVQPNPRLRPLSDLGAPQIDPAGLNGPEVSALRQQAGLL